MSQLSSSSDHQLPYMPRPNRRSEPQFRETIPFMPKNQQLQTVTNNYVALIGHFRAVISSQTPKHIARLQCATVYSIRCKDLNHVHAVSMYSTHVSRGGCYRPREMELPRNRRLVLPCQRCRASPCRHRSRPPCGQANCPPQSCCCHALHCCRVR